MVWTLPGLGPDFLFKSILAGCVCLLEVNILKGFFQEMENE